MYLFLFRAAVAAGVVNLTEEEEEDLANNNDPNNNSSNGDDPLMPDANLENNLAVSAAAAVASTSNNVIEVPDEEMERNEMVQRDLQRDAVLIQRLIPSKSYEEISHCLESHLDNPSRVQVRT